MLSFQEFNTPSRNCQEEWGVGRLRCKGGWTWEAEAGGWIVANNSFPSTDLSSQQVAFAFAFANPKWFQQQNVWLYFHHLSVCLRRLFGETFWVPDVDLLQIFCLIKFSLGYLRSGHFDRKCVGETPPAPNLWPPWDLFEVASTRWTCKLGLEIEYPPVSQNRKINVIQIWYF